MITKKLSTVGCIVLSLVLILGCFITPAKAEATPFSSLSDWMGDLDLDTPITEINIPGTHDTAMFGIGSGIFEGAGFAHNQDLTFAEQLAIGVRFFDGRFCYVKEGNKDETENIFCCHGGFIPEMNDKDISLKDMLNEMNKFLDAHPTEFIFLSYKCESEEDMDSMQLNNLLSKIFYDLAETNFERYMIARPGDPVPTLNRAKGHIVASINSNNGIFSDYCSIANSWSSGTDVKVKELSEVFSDVRPLEKSPRNFTAKSDNLAKRGRAPRVIHTSCYQAPFRTPARTSADIFQWILGKVDSLDGVTHPTFHQGYYYGIILFDYVKEEECRLIIGLNNPQGTESYEPELGEPPLPPTASILGDAENTISICIIAVVLAAAVTFVVVTVIRKRRKPNN